METSIKSLWARIILTTYRNIPRIVESIDRTVDCLSLQGSGSRNSCYSTEQLINKIIDQIYRKQGLINLKVITEEVIKCMNKEYVELLELKYLRGKKFQDIADALGISLRSVFRYYDKALHQFSCILRLKGYDDAWLISEYEGETYLDKIRAKIEEEYREGSNISEGKRNMQVKRVLEGLNLLCSLESERKNYN